MIIRNKLLLSLTYGADDFEVEDLIPDLNETNASLTVYTDTWELSGNVKQKLGAIKRHSQYIKDIAEHHVGAQIKLYCPNKSTCMALQKLLGAQCPSIIFDYYRSTEAIGVESDCRVVIAIGAAETPTMCMHAYSENQEMSAALRAHNVDCDTWQAWSRAKDPEGKVPGYVYCIGIRTKRATQICTWGTWRQVHFVDDTLRDYEITCRELLPLPKIMSPFKNPIKKDRQRPEYCIKTVYYYGDRLPSHVAEVVQLAYDPYIQNELTGQPMDDFGRVYSLPKSPAELAVHTGTLNAYFRGNKTDNGIQEDPKKNKKGEIKCAYHPEPSVNWAREVRQIVDGSLTIGTYSSDERMMCSQCAWDLDTHGDEDGMKTALMLRQLVRYLQDLGLEPLVEASGSEDSYHVYIPIVPAPLATVHNFVFRVRDAMGPEFKKMECFPKNGTYTKLGNLLKLPGCINKKNGMRSCMQDAETYADVPYVPIKSLVELRMPAKAAETVVKKKFIERPADRTCETPRIQERVERSKCSVGCPAYTPGEMRPCVLAIKEEADLTGTIGHHKRIILACEAMGIGMPVDEIVDLFRKQGDFDPETTKKHIKSLSRRWKCETIKGAGIPCPLQED